MLRGDADDADSEARHERVLRFLCVTFYPQPFQLNSIDGVARAACSPSTFKRLWWGESGALPGAQLSGPGGPRSPRRSACARRRVPATGRGRGPLGVPPMRPGMVAAAEEILRAAL